MTQKKQVLQGLQVLFLLFNCQTPEQLSLFDLQFEVKSEKPKKSMEKLKKLSAAMGEIRGKYGADAVIRGSVLEQREKEKKYEKKQF